MITTLYSVKDELAEKFTQPSHFESEAEAKRMFKSQINNIQLWKDNASDFSLYKVGTWDDETGTLIPIIEKIIGGRSVLNER